jgi:hypothetical protein
MIGCDICNNLEPVGNLLVGSGYRTLQALYDSAHQAGCKDCKMLYDGLYQFNSTLNPATRSLPHDQSVLAAPQLQFPRTGDPFSDAEFYLQHSMYKASYCPSRFESAPTWVNKY